MSRSKNKSRVSVIDGGGNWCSGRMKREKAEWYVVFGYGEWVSRNVVKLYFLVRNRKRPSNLKGELREHIKLRDGPMCFLCNKRPGETLHHVVPRSKGGPTVAENLILCCARCHRKLRDKFDIESLKMLIEVMRRELDMKYGNMEVQAVSD